MTTTHQVDFIFIILNLCKRNANHRDRRVNKLHGFSRVQCGRSGMNLAILILVSVHFTKSYNSVMSACDMVEPLYTKTTGMSFCDLLLLSHFFPSLNLSDKHLLLSFSYHLGPPTSNADSFGP